MDIYKDPSMFFKKRKGTTNKGSDYENLIIASLALKLTLDVTVQDFKISSNDDNFGDFDDVIVDIYYTTGQVSKYALQLKYSNDRILTKNSLADQRGNFSIKKYFDNFKKLKNVDDYKFILFTNRDFDISDKQTTTAHGETLKVVFDKTLKLDNLNLTIQETEEVLKISDGRCFNFVPDVPETFFTKFFLCTNQIDIAKLEISVLQYFQQLGCSSNSSAPKDYLEFLKKWSEQEGKKMKLNKRVIRKKLALILVTPNIWKYRSADCHTNCQDELIRNFIVQQKVIGFTEHVGAELAKLWSNAWFMLQGSEQNDAQKIGCLYQIPLDHLNNDDVYTHLLWLMDKCPLIVRDHVTTTMAVQLCPDMNFVILGQRSARKLSSIENLDLQILDSFTFSLQGRATINLSSIRSLANIFTTDHLMASCLCIGENEVLPSTHISRSVTRNVLDWKVLDNINFGQNGDAFVIITSYKSCFQMKYRTLRIEDFFGVEERNWEFYNGKVIFVSENEYSIEDFNQICALNARGKESVHQFRIVKDQLEWVRSKGEISELLNYLLDDHYLTEEEVLKYESDNTLHIVCAGPGMGKTTLMKSITNNSSPISWTLLIYVKNYVGYFENYDVFISRILSQVNDKLEREVVEVLIKQRSIKLIWDGLDEISDHNLSLLLDLIEEFAKMEVTQWLTSRENLKEVLVRRFNVLPRTIREFDEGEQRNYVEKRLQCTKDDLNDIFSKIKTNIQLFPYNNILGIPLQIYILTELLLRDTPKYLDLLESNIFSLVDLYQRFVDEKFKIYFNEKESIHNGNDLFTERNDHFKLELIKTYEEVAVQTLGFVITTNRQFFTKKKDPIGIIVKFGAETATFFHTSFAEYFAASFLSKNRRIIESFQDFLSVEKYDNVRFFFDLLMANKCRPHIAVLYKNVELLKSCTTEELVAKDMAGRNALQLASTWGQKYKIFSVETSVGEYIIDDRDVSVGRDSPEYCEIFDILSKTCDHNERDTLFNFSSLSYASKSRCLISFAKLLRRYKINFMDYHNFEEICSVIYYCVILDCADIFSTVQKIPTIQNHSGVDLLHVAVENDSLNCVKYMTKVGNPENNFLMIVASLFGFNRIVEYFVSIGCDVNHRSYGSTALATACLNGHYDIVKLLLDSGADVDSAIDESSIGTFEPSVTSCEYLTIAKFLVDNGATTIDCQLLHLACDAPGDITWIDLIPLIGKLSDINRLDSFGVALIHKFCLIGDYDAVKLLVNHGASVNVRDVRDSTPLHIVCAANNYDIVKLLVENNALVNSVDDRGQAPLHYVTNDAVVKYLVQNNADVEIKDDRGNTPLHSMVQNGTCDYVKILLLQSSVNCENHGGKTPLHEACQRGDSNIVKLLLEQGANVNVKDSCDRTPLHEACIVISCDIVKLLVEHHAIINSVDENGQTPLHLVEDDTIVNYLIQNKADLGIADNCGNTPLHLMAQDGNCNSVKILLLRAANVNYQNRCGETPLHKACQGGNCNAVKLLLEYKADVNVEAAHGVTPLHSSCQCQNLNIIQLLLDNGAEVNARNEYDEMAIHLCCENGYHDIVKLLIDNGADVNAVTKYHETPIDMAKRWENIVQLLENKGAKQ